MSWLEDEEREIRLESIRLRKRRINQALERYKFIKLLFLIICVSGIFALNAIEENTTYCIDYSPWTCPRCGYEQYNEVRSCAVCGYVR